jgi:hypothetical protein
MITRKKSNFAKIFLGNYKHSGTKSIEMKCLIKI